ncbi:hypothetical protein ACVWYG_001483 [Pedobacter sp. UYEF25]
MGIEKDELRKIANNCKKATFLIEKKQTGKITIREQLELKIHMMGCSLCRIYEKQSLLINKMVKDFFSSQEEEKSSLDEKFKKKLQAEIEKKLKDN